MQFWPECYDEKGNVIPDFAWDQVRRLRNELLTQCDWTQLPDSTADKESWAKYRQELRDITKQIDVDNVVWPIQPETVGEPE